MDAKCYRGKKLRFTRNSHYKWSIRTAAQENAPDNKQQQQKKTYRNTNFIGCLAEVANIKFYLSFVSIYCYSIRMGLICPCKILTRIEKLGLRYCEEKSFRFFLRGGYFVVDFYFQTEVL